jgi:predicted 3-demethylubiquinone-9 3-methyltransferase (glyoxalase superfamily)
MPPLERDSFRKEPNGIFLRSIFTQCAHLKITKMAKNKLFFRCNAARTMWRICVEAVHSASPFGRPLARQRDGAHTPTGGELDVADSRLTLVIHDNDGHQRQSGLRQREVMFGCDLMPLVMQPCRIRAAAFVARIRDHWDTRRRFIVNNRFQRITPFLWFNDQAEEAVNHYVSIFDHSRIATVNRYGKEGANASGRPEGSVMTIAFELDGQIFTALNGGPTFTFNPALSLVVHCTNQQEVDHFWNRLSEGGDPSAQVCGWLKDRYGLSWQIVPEQLIALISNPDPTKSRKVMQAVLGMKKIDIAALEAAAA